MVEEILLIQEVSKRFGKTVIADRISLSIRRGEFFTFLGPSGSGKSTILRMIAGLEPPDSGKILIDGQDMADTPPWRRNLGMVFQQYAIFPHMTVAQNVTYGLKARKIDGSLIKRRVAEMLQLVGLDGFANKDPNLLSGGEQQRVALARALAPQPSILLLDEPLSALDEKIRREMQTELKHIQRKTGTTFVYVTHDQEEALTMSDRIAVLNMGACVQCDVPEGLYGRPRTRFVAQFFRGCNVLDVKILEVGERTVLVELGGEKVEVARPSSWSLPKGRAGAAIRAENLHVNSESHRLPYKLEATLNEIVYRGTNIDYILKLKDGQILTATSTRRYALSPGELIKVGFDPGSLILLED